MFAGLGLSFYLFFPILPPRAFKINELKAEVANHLAMLEKRVECEWSFFVFLPSLSAFFFFKPLSELAT